MQFLPILIHVTCPLQKSPGDVIACGSKGAFTPNVESVLSENLGGI
jgi:hypothetical protein